jgi:sodium transport system permease protein
MRKNHILIVLKKELMDMFRDKKTLIAGIIIPFIIFPIMYGFMAYSSKQTSESANKNIKIAVIGDTKSNFSKVLKNDKNIKIINVKNSNNALKDGKVDSVVNIAKDADKKILENKAGQIKIKSDDSSQKSSMVAEKITNIANDYSKIIVAGRLSKKGINPDILKPINIIQETLKKDGSGEIGMILGMIIPMLLIIYSATLPMAVAIDNGAGEKERGTLEPLLSTCVNRTSLLWGKSLAIMTMGVLGMVSCMGGLGVSVLMVKNMLKGEMGSMGKLAIDPKSIALVLILALMLIITFGTIELSVSVYARSFKEAQTYLTPVSIIVMIPTFATYMMDVKSITMTYFNIPLANVSCLMKELLAGIYNYTHIAIVFGWLIVYLAIAIGAARYMFSREEVIFRT